VIIKSHEELRTILYRVLLAAGADERNANAVADHLALANLSGVDTHGTWHLAGYVEAIRAGEILPTNWPEVVSETPVSALVRGNWTFGQTAARFATEQLIAKAEASGVAVVGLVQANHIGRLGHYAEMAAAAGLIGMVWAGGYSEEAPATVPYGGRKRVLHTNPLSLGFPAGAEPPMMFDFATTQIAGVKVVNAQRGGQPLPPGAVVDKDGHPTTNADDFFAGGAHVPFGGHKGYCLMMATEFLGRIVTGSDDYAEAGRGGAIFGHQGIAFVAFKADLFRPLADYTRQAEEMEQRVRSVPPAPGFAEVLAPGDLEARARAARQRTGIPISDEVWASVVKTAESLGLADIA
jgi:LDH2 family malate/lactate/ureidoglycolate dehydrogenase